MSYRWCTVCQVLIVADGEPYCTDAGGTYRSASQDGQELYLQDTERIYRYGSVTLDRLPLLILYSKRAM